MQNRVYVISRERSKETVLEVNNAKSDVIYMYIICVCGILPQTIWTSLISPVLCLCPLNTRVKYEIKQK